MMLLPTEIADTLRLTRFFTASRDCVYRAWTVAEEFKSWWKPGNYTTTVAELDVRVGGRYRITMKRPDGRLQYLFGEYLEVCPPERLVMTWCLMGSGSDDGYEALLTLEFNTKDTGTEVVLKHENLPKRSIRNFEGGWISMLDQLSHFLTTLRRKAS